MSRQYPERALFLIRQGRARHAVEEVHEGLRESPGDAYLHAILAIAHADLERHEDALRAAHQSIGLAPDFAYAYYAHARVLLAQGRAQEAEAAAREAVRLDPDHTAYYETLSFALLKLGSWAEALRAADRGLALDPQNTWCAEHRAVALRNLGRDGEALKTLRRSLSHDPERFAIHAQLGWALLDGGQPREAVEHFRQALRLDPRSDWVRRGLMDALRAKSPLRSMLMGPVLAFSRFPVDFMWGLLGVSVFLFWLLSAEEAAVDQVLVFFGAIIVFSLLCILCAWTVEPLLNALLLLDPQGRSLLSLRERTAGTYMGVALLAAVAAWGALLVSIVRAFGSWDRDVEAWLNGSFAAALSATALLIPVAATLRTPDGLGRTAMGALTAFLYACAGALVAAVYSADDGWSGPLLAVLGAGIAASMVASSVLAPRE